MKHINKIFGVGMSKTGTTTLQQCLEIIGAVPHKGFDEELKSLVLRNGDNERVFKVAESYRSFQDNPWYVLYRELDVRFPNSKFILTVRKDSLTHAKSSWAHGVRKGARQGAEPAEDYIKEKISIYEAHNRGVLDYFSDRPDDLLVVCWETGDSWAELCNFLEVDIPAVPFPHRNLGDYSAESATWKARLANSPGYKALRRRGSQILNSSIVRKLRS